MICETVGGDVLETLYKHLAKFGRFVVVGGTGGHKKSRLPSASLQGFPGDLSFLFFQLVFMSMAILDFVVI